jgi:uncharacterized protein
MRLSRRSVLKATAAGIVGAAASNVMDEPLVEASEPRRLRVTRHKLHRPDFDRGFRIVHLTDIHVGGSTPNSYLDRVVEIVWRAKADLVVLTGDYVNHSLTHVGRLRRFVGLLPKPCFATLGNHDHWSGADGVTRALRDGGAEVLSNDSLVYAKDGIELTVVGVDDGFSRNDDVPKAFRHVRDPERALVLSHFPNTADRIAQAGGGLILSGHTHGGQFAVPGVTAVVQRMVGNKYVQGWFEIDKSMLYVSAGIGASFIGFRAGQQALPEIAVYDLVPQNA